MTSEHTATESETTVRDRGTTEREGDDGSSPLDDFTGWLAASALRSALVVVGLFLLLTALGQLSGIDILGLIAEALGTDVGRWLFIAVVAITLIAVAVYGFGGQSD